MPSFQYVDDDISLATLVAQYKNSKLLVLDTEFVRTRTFYAKLGLIQAYDGHTLALIDPLAIEDLSGFWQLLTDTNIIKVIHSCSEDLEVFAKYGHCQPSPLFDSQIGASLAGLGHGMGYAKLVNTYLQIEVSKEESRTNWLKRPLSQTQLDYAANDVYYLYQLVGPLMEQLKTLGRLSWVFDEGAQLTRDRLLPPDPVIAYRKVKNAHLLTRQQLATLKVLAKWRLEQAVARDMAIGFIIKDHALIALAKKQPTNVAQLHKLKELTEQERRVHGHSLIKIMASADSNELPQPIDVLALSPGYKIAFKNIKTPLADLCQQQEIPIELLASKRHIHEYMKWMWSDKQGDTPSLLSSWRGQLAAETLGELQW